MGVPGSLRAWPLQRDKGHRPGAQEPPCSQDHSRFMAPALHAASVPSAAQVWPWTLTFPLPHPLIVSLSPRTLSMATWPPGSHLPVCLWPWGQPPSSGAPAPLPQSCAFVPWGGCDKGP